MKNDNLYIRIQNRLQNILFETELSRYVAHIIISILLGVVSGSGAVLFHHLLDTMRFFFEPGHFTNVFNINRLFIVFIPVLGGIIVATCTRLFSDISKERGVLSVIKSIILNNGFIPLKITLFHFIMPIISIGTGAPLGPEGPAAKMGGGLGSFLSQKLRLNQNDMKMYTAAGACAAISAVFNAPIAGVFFGIEVILLNDLKNQALSALIISSVVADVLSRGVLGSERIFNIPAYQIATLEEYPVFLLLGVICGIMCLIFFKMKKCSDNIFNNRLKIKNPYVKLIPVTAVFGIILLKYYHLFGIGYDTINDVINSRLALNTVLILLALRLIFFVLFLSAGAYGGTFAPSIVIGVMTGYCFATIFNMMFNTSLDPVTFALVGMGGMLSGINSIPLTSIMLIFEITNDYKFILPLMLVSIISYLVTVYINRGSVYTNELQEEGIDLTKRGEIDLLGKIKVKDLMRKDFDRVNQHMPFRELNRVLLNSIHGDVIVENDKELLVGIVSFKDIRHALLSNELVDLLITGDITSPVPVVTTGESVSSAIKKIEKFNLETIPVVKGKKEKKVVGILTHNDMIQAYNRLLEEWGTDQFLINYHNKE